MLLCFLKKMLPVHSLNFEKVCRRWGMVDWSLWRNLRKDLLKVWYSKLHIYEACIT